MRGRSRALFVVEPTFLVEHVGVMRVIAHYHRRLEAAGTEVSFAVVTGGELRLLDPETTENALARLRTPRAGTDSPTWTSVEPWPLRPGAPVTASAGPPPVPIRTAGGCRAADYELSVITNPWLCDQPMPDERFTHGIVYDLVPNLLMSQALDLGAPYLGHEFAGAHHRGYAYYADHVDEALCISESTRDDYAAFYGGASPELLVDIPFSADDTAPENDRWHRPPIGPCRLLLVNALDLRKNILGIEAALHRVARQHPLEITVVGRERMDPVQAEGVLTRLAGAGIWVEWYRGASDARLLELYAASDGLVFPSLYEGLGLPILEAQGSGLPAISSDTSSCREVNLNAALQVDPLDVDAIGAAISRMAARDPEVLAGRDLRSAQRSWLATRSVWPSRPAVVAGAQGRL